MRSIILASAVALVFGAEPAYAQQHVRDTRSNGAYVAPYVRSTPGGNPYNNYPTRGNVTPYTGQAGALNIDPFGTVPRQPSPSTSPSPYCGAPD